MAQQNFINKKSTQPYQKDQLRIKVEIYNL